jgi:hypothetical protein
VREGYVRSVLVVRRFGVGRENIIEQARGVNKVVRGLPSLRVLCAGSTWVSHHHHSSAFGVRGESEVIPVS